MLDHPPQPSSILFPIAVQPQVAEESAPVERTDERWGWLELFVLSQVLWGILLFMPGSQAYRTYIRGFPYVASLVALIVCARSTGADSTLPAARWLVAALLVMVANLVHEETWIAAGVAQIIFQASIAAPIFWGARLWITEKRLERLVWLVFIANFASAFVGLLQVYYPDRFLPPEFSALALKLNPDFVTALSYVGTGDRMIIRPPGLTDLPGGAAISGTLAAVLAFAYAMRPNQPHVWRAVHILAVVISLTVVYLTQIRSVALMIVGCMAIIALVKLRQGRVLQSGWIAASATVVVAGAFVWAVTVGGEAVQERYQTVVQTGMVHSYQENRGIFLDYTFRELLFEYPFGAGLGRWGMMSVYFNDSGNWQHPALHAEIQPTGWLYDGGVLLWLCYGGALFVAMRRSYKLAIAGSEAFNDLATMVFLIQSLICGLCLTGPAFNTQLGILFWLSTAVLYGCARTLTLEAEAASDADRTADETATADAG